MTRHRSAIPRRLIALGVFAAAVIAVAACSNGDDAPTTSFEGTDGADLYQQACARCHGADLNGTNQGPPFLDAVYAPGHHVDAAFFLAARAGARAHHWNFGAMPPVPGLSDEQLEAIVAFVRAEQRAAGIE